MVLSYVLYDMCGTFTNEDHSDPSILFDIEKTLNPDEQELLKSGLLRIGCEGCRKCTHEDEDRRYFEPYKLWVETDSDLRKNLSRFVQLKADYRAKGCWFDTKKRLSLKVRALVREILSLRAIDDASLPDVNTEKADEPSDPDILIANNASGTRPTSSRDAVLLAWYEADDTDTYHRPAIIFDKWNELPIEKRKAICSYSPIPLAAKGTLKAALNRARADRLK